MSVELSELCDKLDRLIGDLMSKGGGADTIVLPPIDYRQIVASNRLTDDGRRGVYYRCTMATVRLYEGAAFERGFIDGHTATQRPERIPL